jgi:hypothetical protein
VATDEKDAERLLAVVTLWGFFGAFGIGLVLTGFHQDHVPLGLLGFACFVAAFVAHVIVNHVFDARFSSLQVVVALLVFCLAAPCFLPSWLLDPHFDTAGVIIGVAGFAAVVASFLIYLVSMYGLRGAFSMFHRMRPR